MKRAPHVYAEIIKAWADGAYIQMETANGWVDLRQGNHENTRWRRDTNYRVRPEYIKTPTGWKEL